MSTIKLSKNLVMHNRSKHIDVKLYFLRDMMSHNDINLCSILAQAAYIMKTPLKIELYKKQRNMLGMCKVSKTTHPLAWRTTSIATSESAIFVSSCVILQLASEKYIVVELVGSILIVGCALASASLFVEVSSERAANLANDAGGSDGVGRSVDH
ncbi:LOW QUALITY PROTEIN: hypothetical protein OSB04_002109 [Centaurea solstitialis]|uniref:Uncharacterized protein n=1 Tax=Centaurea solstitialis TaxID=347529 RepID=A0AA38TS87_9ASTR|nr:LOW QUALITY PROTEIN: hypothetical protein OSB04_002109 [Centaurea solstitialis]